MESMGQWDLGPRTSDLRETLISRYKRQRYKDKTSGSGFVLVFILYSDRGYRVLHLGHTAVRRLEMRTSETQTAMLGLSFGRNDEKAASRVMRLAPSRPYDKPVISECTLYVLQANLRAND